MSSGKGDTIVWYRVIRHPQVFRGLTVGQWIPGLWGVTPSKRGDGRKQGGMYEVDGMSSLEAKFEALMTRLNQQTPKEPTIGGSHICKHKVLLWLILYFKLRMQTM